MFKNEIYQFPGKSPQPIVFMSDTELKQAYTQILSDSEGAGVYEPVAEGIRSTWLYRGRDMRVLQKIDKRFKNIRRKELKT